MEKKSTGNDGVNKMAMGMGLVATAIGAYWLYGAKEAKSNRKKAASWMFKARAEVIDAVAKLKEVDKTSYYKLVEDVIRKYSKSYTDTKEAKTIEKEMKSAWYHVGNVVKPAKKVVKRAVKKISNNNDSKNK